MNNTKGDDMLSFLGLDEFCSALKEENLSDHDILQCEQSTLAEFSEEDYIQHLKNLCVFYLSEDSKSAKNEIQRYVLEKIYYASKNVFIERFDALIWSKVLDGLPDNSSYFEDNQSLSDDDEHVFKITCDLKPLAMVYAFEDSNPSFTFVDNTRSNISSFLAHFQTNRENNCESLEFSDFDFSTLQKDVFDPIVLPKLKTLKLKRCKISLSDLKKLTEKSTEPTVTISAQGLQILGDNQDEYNKFIQNKKLQWIDMPAFISSTSDASPNTPPLALFNNPLARTSKKHSVISQKPVEWNFMKAVQMLYTECRLQQQETCEKVEIVEKNDTYTLHDNNQPLIQSNGREVIAYSKLTSTESGIDINVQAKMILLGLGVRPVEVNDIIAETVLPEISDLVFDDNNNNSDLEEAIKTLLKILLEARSELQLNGTVFSVTKP